MHMNQMISRGLFSTPIILSSCDIFSFTSSGIWGEEGWQHLKGAKTWADSIFCLVSDYFATILQEIFLKLHRINILSISVEDCTTLKRDFHVIPKENRVAQKRLSANNYRGIIVYYSSRIIRTSLRPYSIQFIVLGFANHCMHGNPDSF